MCAVRSFKLDRSLDWEEFLRYVTKRWALRGFVLEYLSAELSTGREVRRGNLQELLEELHPVARIVDEVHLGYKPTLGQKSRCALILQFWADEPDPYAGSIVVSDGGDIEDEGNAEMLAKSVHEWVLAHQHTPKPASADKDRDGSTAELTKIVNTPTPQDEVSERTGAATSTASAVNPLVGLKLGGSALVGVLVGATAMSVFAFGWDKGPTQVLSAAVVGVFVALLVYRFGWSN